MKTIILYGLKRSGNHFLLSLILQQFETPVHLNNLPSLSYEEYLANKGKEITVERIDGKYSGFLGADCVVISLENRKIDQDELNRFLENEEDVHSLLILRNPYNNLSSAWKAYNKDMGRVQPILSLWPTYCKEFLDSNSSISKVLYDRLATDSEYLQDIIEGIGISNPKFDDKKNIRWQKSSYKSNENARKCWGSLESSVYGDEKEFKSMFEATTISELWDKVLQELPDDVNTM